MTLPPTREQQDIIDFPGNCVVIAKPGSGKTLTLVHKIKRVLPDLPHYKGVVAISYTNKASDELERRCLAEGIGRKGSFFGTIDKFYLAEIIIPFGRHLFGEPRKELEVVKLEEEPATTDLEPVLDDDWEGVAAPQVDILQQLYSQGKIVLESVGFLAVYVFDRSSACRKYLHARYSHVIIDEYQDCGRWQHVLFSKLVDIGLCGVAVGDPSQSIFAFSGRDPRHLISLAQDSRFRTFALSQNFRNHASIINYSTRLISPTYSPLPTDSTQVYVKRVTGSEIETAHWLSGFVPGTAERFGAKMSGIGIVARVRRTANIIHRNLSIPHRPIIETPLDADSSLWGGLFRRILHLVFSEELTRYELIEDYLSVDLKRSAVQTVMRLLKRITDCAAVDAGQFYLHLDDFTSIAGIILPNSRNQRAVEALAEVLSSKSLIASYMPPREDEVQLMTLHKAKGLEFDIVFHLDLHRWILPMYKADRDQELNLHYVGITRARKCCFLCASSLRHKGNEEICPAEDSEFLSMNELESLCVPCAF